MLPSTPHDPLRATCLHSDGFGWLFSRKCVTLGFFRDLGGEDQSSLICGTWTLQLQNDLSPQCLGVHCYFQPWKTPVTDTRGTWCKTPCLQLESHLIFAVRLKARYAEDVVHYPEGFADTLPESDWQGLPRQMLAHISQQKHS